MRDINYSRQIYHNLLAQALDAHVLTERIKTLVAHDPYFFPGYLFLLQDTVYTTQNAEHDHTLQTAINAAQIVLTNSEIRKCIEQNYAAEEIDALCKIMDIGGSHPIFSRTRRFLFRIERHIIPLVIHPRVKHVPPHSKLENVA